MVSTERWSKAVEQLGSQGNGLGPDLVKDCVQTSSGGTIHNGSQVPVCGVNRAIDDPQWELLDSGRTNCFYLTYVGVAVQLGTKLIDSWEGYQIRHKE